MMKQVSFVLVAALALFTPLVNANLCSRGSTEISGNWFCQPVTAIQYSNVGFPGTYQQIIDMPLDGKCASETTSFSGPLSPLDEEVSFHFRGPLALKQFAAYMPTTSSVAKRQVSLGHARRHGHHHLHHKRVKLDEEVREVHEFVKRADVIMATATIDGKVVSWVNNWFGPCSTSAPSSSTNVPSPTAVQTSADIIVVVETGATRTTTITVYETDTIYGDPMLITTITTLNLNRDAKADVPNMATATIDGQVVSWTNNYFGPTATITPVTISTSASEPVEIPAPIVTPFSESSSEASIPEAIQPSVTIKQSPLSTRPSSDNGNPGDYTRTGYYDSESQTLDNLVFLGNYGGQGSGCFDYVYGASLAYANSAGTGGAEGPQILEDCTLPSDTEVIVMLGEECGETDCGYVRPGSVAYHGFDGADKVFLMEFSMPHDTEAGFNGDMPAIWMLNAEIPRTLQYGNANCSCWATGCGEFDLVETLYSGSNYLKSTLHTNTPGSDPDYIERPTDAAMKLAIVFNSANSTAQIQVLDDNFDFSSTLTISEIESLCTGTREKMSHFTIST